MKLIRSVILSILCCCGSNLAVKNCAAQVIRPVPVPGRVEAEDYDTNGPSVSFYDNSAGNSGGVYRMDDVDIEATLDVGGGYNVGWIASGEWLNYTLNVRTTAVYQIAFRVASANGPGNIQVALDGLPLCSVPTPLTGGWQAWQTVTVSNIVLCAGPRLLHLEFQTGGQNLNYIQFTPQAEFTGRFLRSSGKQIVDGQARNVVLRGMGLGNWMLQEPYMMDVSGLAENQQQLKARIAELVGPTNMETFYSAWLTNYIGAEDVAALAAHGFNSIRVPMHYNLFTLPLEQEPIPGQNTWLTVGFQLLDSLLGWCESNRVYLILDMHACPGGQGQDKAISDYNPPAPALWESTFNRDKLIALWRQIAARYANSQWIGGYDLINEPNWTFENNTDIHGCADQTNAPLRQLLMDLTAAIRQVDTNHLIFLEGNCWAGNYNGILPPWDSNLAISFHKYWDQPTAASLQAWVDKRNQWNMPLWLGESGENSNEWFREVVRNAEQANIGWSWWPWKKIGTIAGPTMVTKPAGYQAILDYWRGSGPRPSTNDAVNGLFALAQAARYENCVSHPDVFDALLRPSTGGLTVPFKTHSVPGIIFAADYDLGAFGEAYADQTTNGSYNSGSSYRNDSVDIERCFDSAPALGYDVGWMDAGDWMKYTISAILAQPFAFTARVASSGGGGRFHVEVGGSNVTGSVIVPSTGGWQSWVTLAPRVFTNAWPADSLKVVVENPGLNLHWVQFTSVLPAAPTGLVASATSLAVHLAWNPVSGAVSYNVSRSGMSGGPYTPLASNLSLTHYSDLAVTNGQIFYYVVTAVNSYGESGSANEISVQVPFPALSVNIFSGAALLSWSNSASPLKLFTATNLLPPVAWASVTNPVTYQNGVWKISWLPDGRLRFFRLAVE